MNNKNVNQEQELNELRERVSFLELLLSNLPHDLVVFNDKHEYLFINEKAIRDPEIRNWMLNKTDFDYCEMRGLPAELARARRSFFEQVAQNKKAVVFEEQKSGEVISRNMYPIFEEQRLKYVLGYAFNVTQIQQLNDQLLSSHIALEHLNKKLKEDFERERLRVEFRRLIVNAADIEALCRDFTEEIRKSFNADYCLLRLYSSEFDRDKHFGFSYSNTSDEDKNNQIQELSAILDQMRNTAGSESKSYCPLNYGTFSGMAYAIRSGENAMQGCLLIGGLKEDETGWQSDFFQEISRLLAMRIVELRSILKIKQLNEELNRAVELRTSELLQLNRGLEMFVGTVSHDLKGPLRLMMNYLKLLNRHLKGTSDETVTEYLSFLSKSSSDLFNLVTALLQFSRAGNSMPDMKQIGLNEMLLDILRSMGLSVQDEHLSIQIRAEGEMRADPVLLRQVLVNLISNAVKFSGKQEKALIEIQAGPSGEQYQITVKDNGIGFDSKKAADLFQPFKRFHEAKDYDGNGMGLAIVHTIVKRHSGDIQCSSEPGKGTQFTLTFPLPAQQQ